VAEGRERGTFRYYRSKGVLLQIQSEDFRVHNFLILDSALIELLLIVAVSITLSFKTFDSSPPFSTLDRLFIIRIGIQPRRFD